jgi:hypothetical protein
MQKKQVRNLADLALLSQGLLKGNELTNFINRSVELLQGVMFIKVIQKRACHFLHWNTLYFKLNKNRFYINFINE